MEEDEDADLVDGYYGLVRKLDYTWEEVLNEKFSRIMFSIEKLIEEKERMEEDMPENPRSGSNTTMQK